MTPQTLGDDPQNHESSLDSVAALAHSPLTAKPMYALGKVQRCEYLRICSASSLVITMSVTPLPHFLGVQPGGRESRRNADYQSHCPKIIAELARPSTVTRGQVWLIHLVKSQLQINSGNFSPELCPVHSLRAHISFPPVVLGFSQTHTG